MDSQKQSPSAAYLLNPRAFQRDHKAKVRDQNQSTNRWSTTQNLLSPASYSRAQPTPQSQSRPVHAREPKMAESESSGTVEGDVSQPSLSNSMLADVYGVEKRAQPAKRRITELIVLDDDDEDEEPKSKRGFTHHQSTGIIGNYLKEENKNPPNGKLPVYSAVEESAVKSDDDVVFIDPTTQEVCYGLISTKVQAHKIPKPVRTAFSGSTGVWPHISCKTVRELSSRDHVIKVVDPNETEFARIVPEVAKALAPLIDSMPNLRLQCKLLSRKKNPDDWPGRPTSESMNMVINMYGPRKDAPRLGQFLGQNNIWLQNPMMSDKGIPHVNPHSGNHAKATKFKVTTHLKTDERTYEEAADAVTKLFDSVALAKTVLPSLDTPDMMTTELLEHQQQALWWMLEREKPRTFGDDEASNSSLWRKEVNEVGRPLYREIVASVTTNVEPPQVFGGLLADVMGLGKTIEVLALMASTMDQAKAFSGQKLLRDDPRTADLVGFAKSTLLVSPLSAVKNWEDQTKEHLKPGSMSIYVYHGVNRTQNVYELAKYDLVVTTYGTLGADLSRRGKNVLHRLNWFRIVLDEAHTIREAKSMQASAVFRLSGQRRWALTGTPIQNRLDDLGAITQFLRLTPYHDHASFIKYIRAPAMIPGNDDFLKSLRVFVDSFTLRRLKDRVDLPARHESIEILQFTDEEKWLHDFFKDRFDVQLTRLVRRQQERKANQVKGAGGYIKALQGILALRLICAHGKDLLNETNRKYLQGATKDDAIDLEEPTGHEFTESKAHEDFAMMVSADVDFCCECRKRIGGETPSSDGDDDDTIGFLLPCTDLVCKECFKTDRPVFDENDNTSTLVCPYCQMVIPAKYVALSSQPLDPRLPADDVPAAPKAEKSYTGPHTKTKALLRDLDVMYEDSKPLVAAGEPPLKAIVFSEFTSHLDLIERALTDHGYGNDFTRIDGRMGLPARRRVLDALATDPTVTILLASIKAAGQGLNLTAASRAFIMEPMWNPAAEQQAVDRIYRLGQTREVFIKRYHMHDSIEGKIMEIQRKKTKLANLSMERNHDKLSRKEERAAHMKDLLGMFK